MKYFLIGNIFDDAAYSIVHGIYITVARMYNYMMELVDKTSQYDFDNIISNIYVVVGVFMLFRVAVGFINMLINPDQIGDKNVGAGKLLTRVIMTIILLIIFSPSGILLKQDPDDPGLFDRLQDAVIGPGGLLEKFAPEASTTENRNIALDNNYVASFDSNFLFENVYAAESSKVCYFANFVHISSTGRDSTCTGCTGRNQPACCNSNNRNHQTSSGVTNKYYKVTFYKDATKATIDSQGLRKMGEKSSIYLKFETTSETLTVDGENIKFDFQYIDYPSNTNNTTASYVGQCNNWGLDVDNKQFNHDTNGIVQSTRLFQGYNSLTELYNAVYDDYVENKDIYDRECEDENSDNCSELTEHLDKVVSDVLPGVKDDAIGFARNTLSSFETCTKNKTECEDAKQAQFSDDDNYVENITEMMDSGDLSLEFIMALISGIVLVAFIVLLCFDVVVRNLKLMLLKMIAPIPIVCYSDPKDQIFSRWIKTFFSVYCDLFFKLLAVKFVLILVKQMTNWNLSGLDYFFVIIGILIFAKAVPSIISKIFGFESNSSFKDIFGMAKAGAGFAAGAAIGLGAAGISGYMANRTQGGSDLSKKERLKKALGTAKSTAGAAASGAIRGAASGMKGNLTGGAKSATESVFQKAAQKKDGLNLADRMLVGVAAATGTGAILAGGGAQLQLDKLGIVAQKRQELEDIGEKQLNKKGATILAKDMEDNKDEFGNTYKKGFDKKKQQEVIQYIKQKYENDESLKDLSVDQRKELIGQEVAFNMQNDIIGTADETSFDWKSEIKKQNIISQMTVSEWDGMNVSERIRQFGSSVGTCDTLNEAQVKMDNRIAVLKDYGIAQAINNGIESDHPETVLAFSALKDATVEAEHSGATVAAVPDHFDGKTMDDIKDTANNEMIRVGKENEKQLARNKYISTGGNK